MFKEIPKCHRPRGTIWKTRVRKNRNGINAKALKKKQKAKRNKTKATCLVVPDCASSFLQWEF